MAFRCLILLIFTLLAGEVGATNSLRLALSSSPSNLSPFFSTDANSQNINRLLHLSLTDFSETMNFQCRLCSSFTEKVKNGEHRIYFKLRKDVKFWDGIPIKASDVKKSWEYFAKDSAIKSVFRFTFERIKDVIVHGPHEVELVYYEFSLGNLSDLALLKIIRIEKNKVIGAGPYQLGEVTPLEIELLPLDKSKPKLIFKVVKDETTLALKLLNNEVDLSLASISPRKYHWLKSQKDSDLAFWERSSSTFNYMGINHRRPLLKDRRVRRALSLLIPRQDILKYKLKQTAVLSSGMFSPAFAKIYPGEVFDKNDIIEAERLLAAAGFKKNSEGKLERQGKVFSLEWKVSNNKATLEIVHTLKSYFERAGIVVHVVVQEWGTFFRGIKQGKFDIMVGRWIGFTGPDMLKYVFHSKSQPPKGANRGFYVNSEADHYLDLATTEIDEKKRNKYYRKALDLINKDYAYINLWHPNIIWVGRKCLGEIGLHPNGSFHPLLELESHCGK